MPQVNKYSQMGDYLIKRGGILSPLAGAFMSKKGAEIDQANIDEETQKAQDYKTAIANYLISKGANDLSGVAGADPQMAITLMNRGEDRKNAVSDRDAEQAFELSKINNAQNFEKDLLGTKQGFEKEMLGTKQNYDMQQIDAKLAGLAAQKGTQPTAFDKELQKQQAKQYAALTGEVAQGDADLQNLTGNINRALQLNKEARAGGGANIRQGAARFFGGGKQTTAGAELQGIMRQQVVENLKKIFGGQISDAEREYLDKLNAADLSMSEGEREALIRGAFNIAQQRVGAKKAALNTLFKKKPAAMAYTGEEDNPQEDEQNGEDNDPLGIL